MTVSQFTDDILDGINSTDEKFDTMLGHPEGKQCSHCGATRSPQWVADINGNVFCSDECHCHHQQAKQMRQQWAAERAFRVSE